MYFSRETEQDDILVIFCDHLVGMKRPGDVLFGGKGDYSPHVARLYQADLEFTYFLIL